MCDTLIQEGVPATNEGGILEVRERFNCVVRTSDNQYVYIELPKDTEAQRNFLEGIPIYNETNLPNEGIFTWIIYSGTDSVMKFAATETITPFEIGTMHKTLAYLVKAVKIHGAGEIRIDDTGKFFNVLSGTYMLEWLLSHTEDPVCDRNKLQNAVIQLARRFLKGFSIPSTTTSFITQSQRIDPEILELYRASGFIVKVYPDKASCTSDPSTSLYKLAQARLEAQRKMQEAQQARIAELGKRTRSP